MLTENLEKKLGLYASIYGTCRHKSSSESTSDNRLILSESLGIKWYKFTKSGESTMDKMIEIT